jgi:hypothetical protein
MAEKNEETVNAVVTRTRSPNVAGDVITMTRAEFDDAVGVWVEAHDGSALVGPEENRQRAAPRRTRG